MYDYSYKIQSKVILILCVKNAWYMKSLKEKKKKEMVPNIIPSGLSYLLAMAFTSFYEFDCPSGKFLLMMVLMVASRRNGSVGSIILSVYFYLRVMSLTVHLFCLLI